jgi:hypothetical protein
VSASFTCLALSGTGESCFVPKCLLGSSLPSLPGAQILSWLEAPLIFIAGPQSHEPPEGTS